MSSPPAPSAAPEASPVSDPVRRAVRELQAEVAAYAGDPGASIADTLAQCLSAQYALFFQQALRAADGQPLEPAALRAFVNDVTALRRGDHSAARLQLEYGSLTVARQRLHLEAERVMLDMDEQHLRWKSKLEMALQAFEHWVDRKHPQAKAAFAALALAVRDSAAQATKAAGGAVKPAAEFSAGGSVGAAVPHP